MASCERSEFFTLSMDMSKIARALGRHPDELIGYQDPKETDNYRLNILGHHLTASDVSLSNPKVCPECVLELGHIPVWTDFSIVDACPTHGRHLLTHCAACKQKLSWLRPGLLVCRCNADLSRMRGSPITSVHCEFLWQLVAKILGNESANRFAMPIDKFNAMSLGSVLGFSRAMSRIDRATSNEHRSVAEGAARMLMDWPNNLYLSLREMTPPDGARKGYLNLRKHMEGVYLGIVKDISDASDVAFLRSVFNQFAQSLVDPAPGSVPLANEYGGAFELAAEDDYPLASSTGAAKSTPLRKKRRQSEQRSPKARWWPTEPGSRNLGVRQAAQHIGLPVAVLTMLRQTGHFEARHKTVSVKTFHEKDLDAFIEKMMGLVQANPAMAGDTDVVSLGDLMMLKFKFTKGKAELIAAILDGHIPVIGNSGSGVRDLLVSHSRSAEFIEASRSKAYGNAWSEKTVSEFLHCDFCAVEALVRGKYLTGTRYASGMRIDIESVKRFQLEYRSLASLANVHGTTSTTLVRLLKEAGIDVLSLNRAGRDIQHSFMQLKDIPRFEELVLPGLIARRRTPFLRVTALDRLEAYLSGLRETGESLPRVGQKPHFTKISEACGFERSVFYKDAGIKKAIAAFDEEDRLRHKILSPKVVLENYLAYLKLVGVEIPYCGSGPNLRTIAEQCGFSRNEFYKHPKLRGMLEKTNRF
jgi:hypothetical protein